MAPNRIYEVCQRRVFVYTEPSTFSAVLSRLGRGRRFVGRVVRTSWVQRDGSGYVRLVAVRDLGVADVSSTEYIAFLDALTPRERFVVQGILAQISHLLNNDRVITIEDVQGLEDRASNQQRQIKADELRQDDADARMDADEAHDERQDDRLDKLEAGR